jgi:hypothetical protein
MSDAANSPDDTAPALQQPWWQRLGFWVGVFAFGIVLSGLIVALWNAVLDRGRDEEIITVLLATMLLLLLVTFALVAVGFKRAGLAVPDQALGLPQGSVRALIAFVLLLIFSMLAIFLFAGVDSLTEEIEGVSPAQFESLDLTEVAGARAVRDDDGAIVEYTVTLRRPNAAQVDLAKQLTTPMITLITAIAAFYFGARTSTTSTDVLAHRVFGLDADNEFAKSPQQAESAEPPPSPAAPEEYEVLEGHPLDEPDDIGEADNTVG